MSSSTDSPGRPRPLDIQRHTILSPLSSYDPNPIRRVAYHVYALLNRTTSDFECDDLPKLHDLEEDVVARIRTHLLALPENHLFKAICNKFANACECSDKGVLKAAQDFALLCLDGVVVPSMEKKNEYEVVRKLVDMMEQSGSFNYGVERDAFISGEANMADIDELNHGAGDEHQPYAIFERGEDQAMKLPRFGTFSSLHHSDLDENLVQNSGQQFTRRRGVRNSHHGLSGEHSFVDLHGSINDNISSSTTYRSLNYVADLNEDGNDDDDSIYQESEADEEEEEASKCNYIYSRSDHNQKRFQANRASHKHNSIGNIDLVRNHLDEDDRLLANALQASIDDQRKSMAERGGVVGVPLPDSKVHKAKLTNLQKNRAVRKRGEFCVRDETYDRRSAKPGAAKPSMLRITINTVHEDPHNPGQMVPSNPATYVYLRKVDWANKESVAKLNQWRCQVFRRTLGPLRTSRPKWTILEHDKLIAIIENHLSGVGIDGRYSRIQWDIVADDFNRYFSGCVFPKAEPLAHVQGMQRKDKSGRSSLFMKSASPFVARSTSAIVHHLNNFTSSAARELVGEAKALDEDDRLRGYVDGDADKDEFMSIRRRKTKATAVGPCSKRAKSIAAGKRAKSNALASSGDIPFQLSDMAVSVAQNARARQPRMIETQNPTFATALQSIPDLYAPAPDLLHLPSIINPPQHFFRHAPRSRACGEDPTSPSTDNDLTEEELESQEQEHVFTKMCREQREQKGESFPPLDSAGDPRPLSPFRDLAEGDILS